MHRGQSRGSQKRKRMKTVVGKFINLVEIGGICIIGLGGMEAMHESGLHMVLQYRPLP